MTYVARELLPSLATRYFGHAAGAGDAGAGLDFKVAVVSQTAPHGFVFQSPSSFSPTFDAQADATADLFQVRTQDFLSLAAEVRRFTAFVAPHERSVAGTARVAITEMTETRPMSIRDHAWSRIRFCRRRPGQKTTTTTETRLTSSASPHWKLVVTHPSGSLEAVVTSQRRRNLAISSSVLGLLGASMGLLVLATRRAQRLAKQQMEFVAAVSHELRTPLGRHSIGR